MDTKELGKKQGYIIIRNFIDKDFAKFIESYFFTRIKSGISELGDTQASNSYCIYGDPLMDTILNNAKEEIGKIIGFKLLPTYSYTRLYGRGDELKKHRDRPSCEFSATLTIAVPDGEKINPIYFSKSGEEDDIQEVLLEPGDLCVYDGCNVWHWREPFTQKWYLQSFLHYVNADGPFTHELYDKRQYLGLPSVRDKI